MSLQENRRITKISPDGLAKNQIDFIITNHDNKGSIKNSRSHKSADIGSDHSLVIATIVFEKQIIKHLKRKTNDMTYKNF